MGKGVKLIHVLVTIVLTYFIAMFFFSVFNFHYNFFGGDAFNLLYTFIQFAVYLVVFQLVYKQIAFLFNRKFKHDV